MNIEKTIPEMITSRVKKYGGKLLFQHKDGWSWKQITWLDFEKGVKDAASFLMGLGFSSGNTALIISGNRLESLYSEFAIYLLGGILIRLAADESVEKIVQIAKDSNSRVIFIEKESTLRNLRNAAGEIPGLMKIATFSDANIGEDKKVIPFKGLLKFGSIKRKELTDELARAADGVLPDSAAAVFYSYNSNGKFSKREITHRGLAESLHAASEKLSFITEEDQAFSYLSSVSLFERFVNYLGIYMGIRIVLSETREEFFEDILEVKPTILFETKNGLENISSKVISNLGKNSPSQKLRAALGGRVRYILTDSLPRAEIKNLFSKSGISLIEISELVSR